MKKILFFAAAAVAVMTSCSSSDDAIANDPAPVNGEEIAEAPEAIQLGVSNNIATVAVRGTGTVGTTDIATNKWGGQNFNVYMFKKGTLNDTIYSNEIFYAGIAAAHSIQDGAAIFTGVDDTTLPDSVSTIRPKNDEIKYYPSKGSFDFVAYRLDSAEVAAPVNDGTNVTCDFKIDGSQDVMVAAAVPTLADSTAIAEAVESGSGATVAGRQAVANRFYSSYTSRKDIIPTLYFKHLLSRLNFIIIPGTDEAVEATNGVRVDSIKVISKTEGTLTIAPAAAQGITGWAAEDSLTLKERATGGSNYLDSLNLIKLSQLDLCGETKGSEYPLGEALLVAPGETSYKVSVFLSQNVANLYSDRTDTRLERYEVPATIKLDEAATVAFGAGKSYTIKITVNGLREIIVRAALDKWIDGGSYTFDPENDDFE